MEQSIASFKVADSQVLGVSVDSKHSHANWASSLTANPSRGRYGIRIPQTPMELYYYEACGCSQVVLNTLRNLKILEQTELKDIREHPDFEAELIERTGNKTVPCLVVEGKTMKESETIKKYLVSRFL